MIAKLFYSGVDGALKGTHDLDPMDIVPYRWERGHPSNALALDLQHQRKVASTGSLSGASTDKKRMVIRT